MKNLLLYNYDIDIDTFQNITDGITFYINYNKYYFVNIHRVSSDIEKIYDMLNSYINPYHYIIKNKFGSIITEDNKKNYVLIKVKGSENDEIDLRNILNNEIKIDAHNNILRRDNWGNLWSEKIDYLEYQISELGASHHIILSSFSYYDGLAENAIELYNMIDNKNEMLVISQKRIKYPNISLNYYNPLNIVIDYRVRDIAEYLKDNFFNDGNTINELNYLISKNILTKNEYNLLYARLLYPSYYFDEVSSILENNKEETVLLKYINKVNEYEKFLKNTYYLLSKKSEIIKVEWLIKAK